MPRLSVGRAIVVSAGAVLALAGCKQPPQIAASIAPSVASAIAAPVSETTPFRSYPRELASNTVTLHLPGADAAGGEREYMVHMNAGDSLVYSWNEKGADENEFYYEVHGQDPADPDKVIASFEKQMGNRGNGAFTVTTPGDYGWFFQNQSMKPATVTLRISGFYGSKPPAK